MDIFPILVKWIKASKSRWSNQKKLVAHDNIEMALVPFQNSEVQLHLFKSESLKAVLDKF